MITLKSNDEAINKYIYSLIIFRRYDKLLSHLGKIGEFNDEAIVYIDEDKYPGDMYVVDNNNNVFTFSRDKKESTRDSITKNKNTTKEIKYTYSLINNVLIKTTYNYLINDINLSIISEPKAILFAFGKDKTRMELYLEKNSPKMDLKEKFLINKFVVLLKNVENINIEKIYNLFFIQNNTDYERIEFEVEYNKEMIGSIKYYDGELTDVDISDKLDISNKFKNKLLLK